MGINLITKSNKEKVFESYEYLVEWFDQHRTKDLSLERSYLNLIMEDLPQNAKILDLGCGTGDPLAKFFIENGHYVTGVDGSHRMISLCKERFPDHRFIVSDMREIILKEKFDLVLAWHSFFHLPQEDQRKMFKKFSNFTKVGGLLVFTSGTDASEEWGNNGGIDLYHASLSTEEYRTLFESGGFQIIIHNICDPNCGEATVWIAKKIKE
jgi:ubiquinone/menaquinone biosynthesis C-methylase UbiE